MANGNQYNGLEIAIIGISAQFPGAGDYWQYWLNLREGRESLTFFTDEELRSRGVPDALLQDGAYVRSGGGILQNKDCFDHGFFGYSPEEAALMDPQIRFLHQHCWGALEDAGYASGIEKKKIGLFAGASVNSMWQIYAHSKSANTAVDSLYLKMITHPNFIATLVSYKLNLRGPSLYVDSACSTSLMAVHLACRSLLTRECSMALAGGVSIQTVIRRGYIYQEGQVSSNDGHCRAFDAAASGTAAGEGAGIVVLKRLSEAISDKDHIYAVIKATAINNDGSQKAGYTTPSVKGQVDCILTAQKLANVPPRSISYVETHGTGTRLGDPVEIRALNEAFATGGGEKFCAIGSVKTNIGHLDTAAGVAGLIKTALCLQHRQLPPSLNFREANPEIDFSAGPFYVNTTLQEWQHQGEGPLRAGVSSFGIGGTNAHAILEAAPDRQATDAGRPYKLLTVSAKTAQSVQRYLDSLTEFLSGQEKQSASQDNPPASQDNPSASQNNLSASQDNLPAQHLPAVGQHPNLADLCYTLQTGRKEFGYRQSLTFKDRDELLHLLRSGALKPPIRIPERSPSIVFLFSGQGAQYADMAKGVYEGEPVFREQMDKGFALLEKLTGQRFKDVLFGKDDGQNSRKAGSPAGSTVVSQAGMTGSINETRYTQPLLFLVEYSLAIFLHSIGITPRYMIGHSIGEYTAACLSGVFSFEEALRLVAQRGALMNTLAPGAMLSVSMTAAAARPLLNGHLSLAAVNGPEQIVLSGDLPAIEKLKAELEGQDIPYIQLHTSHAFHSSMVEPIRAAFRKELERTTFHKPAIPFISNVTGTFIQETEACSPDYWVRHMREPVHFSQGLQTILSQGSEAVFVELGAGRSLISLLKQQADAGTPAVNLVRTAKEKEDDLRYLTEGIGLLWSRGINIDWNNYYTGQQRYKLSLPAYSFEPVRYPVEVDPFKGNLLAGLGLQDNTANTALKDWVYHPSWKRVTAPGEASEVPGRRRYLFFSVDRAFSTSLTEQLLSGETGHEVTEVLIGQEYQQLGVNRYTLDPGNPGHYDQLLTALTASETPVSDIIYSWGMDIKGEALALEKDNPALNRVYFGLGFLVRSLLQTGLLKEKRIAVLTEGLYKVMGTEEGSYAQSLLLGLVNVLPQEYSVTCFNIDLPSEGNIRTSLLAEEIRNNNGKQDRIVALRHDRRWIPDYQKNTAPIEKPTDKIRPGGNYLVTGGLGKVGFVLGKYLLQQYGVRLILTGRKEFSQLKEEASYHYNTLCGISREVYYFPGDISDTAAWEQTIARIEQQFGRIDGVIHTAGITDDHYFEPIGDLTVEKTLAMWAPKVNGIENLYRVFRDRQPDFVWITSSLSTVLGGLGFSAYSSANLYMDHFLWSKTDELPGWRCIGLGGMAFTTEDIRKESGPARTSLRPEELAALFDWSLTLKDSPVLIQSVEDLSIRAHRVYEVKKEAYLDDDKDVFKQVWVERPPLSSLHKAPGTATEKGLTALYEAFFGIADIGIDDNFFELGGDSLKAMKLLKRIKHEFDTPITLTTFLANTTIRQIGAKLDEQLWLAADVKMDNEMLI